MFAAISQFSFPGGSDLYGGESKHKYRYTDYWRDNIGELRLHWQFDHMYERNDAFYMLYTLGTNAGKIWVQLTGKLSVSGVDNVPKSGPVILASNHKSNLDPFCIGSVLPRQVHFLAKDELFHNPLLAWLMRKWGTVQVKRGESDRAAITAAMQVLKQGRMLGIFVEGTRRTDIDGLGDLKAGAAMLSYHAKAPIVPVAIRRIGRAVYVNFGPPISLEKIAAEGEAISRKTMYAKINEAITSTLSAMLAE